METAKSSPDHASLESALAACRPDGVHSVDFSLLDSTPLLTEGVLSAGNRFEAGLRELGRLLGKGLRLVFDLDDTLLNTDFTAREAWFPDPLGDAPGVDAWRYAAMRRDAWLTLRNGWRLPRRHCYSPSAYPFLRNLRVRAQWRPGALALLIGLRESGCDLFLATATARSRWSYLQRRFPVLTALFPPGHVACATDLLAAALGNDGADTVPGLPANFYTKMPDLLCRAFGVDHFDFLIDDSSHVARAYEAGGNAARLIPVSAAAPHGDQMATLALTLAQRTGQEAAATGILAEAARGTVTPSASARFEDPLYFPTLHIPERHDRTVNALRAFGLLPNNDPIHA